MNHTTKQQLIITLFITSTFCFAENNSPKACINTQTKHFDLQKIISTTINRYIQSQTIIPESLLQSLTEFNTEMTRAIQYNTQVRMRLQLEARLRR